MSQYDRQLFEYFAILDRKQRLNPLVLGGITASGGGSGSPMGGFIGTLPQTRVSYDLSELATLDTVASGESLLDNLNHIRYRIEFLEAASGGGGGGAVSIYDDTVLQGAASELDFTTGITATVVANRATISAINDLDDISRILVTNGTNTIKTYAATSAGLTSALSASINNDRIYIPKGSYTISNPINFTTKNVSLIGSGMIDTFIYIDNDAGTNAWCISMTYAGSTNPITIKDLSIEFMFTGAPSGTSMGWLKLDDTSGIVLENVRLFGNGYVSNAIAADSTFYALYLQGGIENYYDYFKTVVRNVKIDCYAYVTDDWGDIVGAYIRANRVEDLDLYIESDWCKSLTGYQADGVVTKNSKIVAKRLDTSETNNVTIGIDLISGDQSFDNITVDIYNYHGNYLVGGGSLIGVRDYYGNTLYNNMIISGEGESYTPGGVPPLTGFVFVNILDTVRINNVACTGLLNNPAAIIAVFLSVGLNTNNKYIIVTNSSLNSIKLDTGESGTTGSYTEISPGYVKMFSTDLSGTFISRNIEADYAELGAAQIGDISGGNYLNIASNGNVTISGNPVVSLVHRDIHYATKGDILVALGASNAFPLSVGTDGQVLTADSGEILGVKWDNAATLGNNTFWQAKGDMVVASGLGAAGVLSIGADGQILVVDPAEPLGVKWEYVTVSGIPSSSLATDILWDAKGDLVIGSGSDYAMRLPVGTTGQALVVDSSEPLGVKWGDVSSILLPGGRLTLTTGVPVTTADVTGATHVYYTPYVHNGVQVWDGTSWVTRYFTEIDTNIAGYTASKPYDFFGYDNSGSLAIETLVWTSGTARATDIERQDGRLVKVGDKTRLYLGTVYINSSGGQTDDSYTKRFVYNNYNRKERVFYKKDTSAHAYTTASWRYWNNSSTHIIEFICGILEEGPFISFAGITDSYGLLSATLDGANGDGYSTNNNDITLNTSNSGGHRQNGSNRFNPMLGYHFVSVREYGQSGSDFTNYRLAGSIDA